MINHETSPDADALSSTELSLICQTITMALHTAERDGLDDVRVMELRRLRNRVSEVKGRVDDDSGA